MVNNEAAQNLGQKLFEMADVLEARQAFFDKVRQDGVAFLQSAMSIDDGKVFLQGPFETLVGIITEQMTAAVLSTRKMPPLDFVKVVFGSIRCPDFAWNGNESLDPPHLGMTLCKIGEDRTVPLKHACKAQVACVLTFADKVCRSTDKTAVISTAAAIADVVDAIPIQKFDFDVSNETWRTAGGFFAQSLVDANLIHCLGMVHDKLASEKEYTKEARRTIQLCGQHLCLVSPRLKSLCKSNQAGAIKGCWQEIVQVNLDAEERAATCTDFDVKKLADLFETVKLETDEDQDLPVIYNAVVDMCQDNVDSLSALGDMYGDRLDNDGGETPRTEDMPAINFAKEFLPWLLNCIDVFFAYKKHFSDFLHAGIVDGDISPSEEAGMNITNCDHLS